LFSEVDRVVVMATTRRQNRQQAFHDAVVEAYQRHGFRSYRQAERITGVNYSTIYTLVSSGRIPTRGQVIEWAEGINEPINYWLELAGYDPIEPRLVAELRELAALPDERLLEDHPAIREVVSRLESPLQETTQTREQAIERAFHFVITDPDVQVGSAGMADAPLEAKLSLIRYYERKKGRKLLDDDVI
jgi:hypothetical protein